MFAEQPLLMLFWMLVGHALADYPLQGEFLAANKSRRSPLNATTVVWPHALTAHSLIHAGAVVLVTGSLLCGVLEFVAHWVIDAAKCEGWTTLHSDQALHVVCKLLWMWVVIGH